MVLDIVVSGYANALRFPAALARRASLRFLHWFDLGDRSVFLIGKYIMQGWFGHMLAENTIGIIRLDMVLVWYLEN